MKTLLKIFGILFGVAAVLFTACAVVDYFYRLPRGDYFDVPDTDDDMIF